MFTPTVLLIPSVVTLDDSANPEGTVVVTGPVLDDLPRVYSVYVLNGEHSGAILGAVGMIAERRGRAIYSWQPLTGTMDAKGCRSLDEATDNLVAATIGSENA